MCLKCFLLLLEHSLSFLLVFPPSSEDREANLLCPVNQNSTLSALVAGPRGRPSQSRGYPDGKLMLFLWHTPQWVRFALLVLEPIRLEAFPLLGLALLGFPFTISVRRSVGPQLIRL